AALIGHEDVDKVNARIEGVEAKFESETSNALREVRVGSVGEPATYEYYGNKYWKYSPATVYLDHRNILPIDPAQGDALEIRIGRDNWRDITGEEGQRWTANYRKGKLEIYSRLRQSTRYRNINDDRFVRLTYRYGSLGGDRNSGGETTLAQSLATDVTGQVDVANVSRLPASGGTMLLGGAEYVSIETVDPQADTVTIRERGLRATQSVAFESGDTLHYCPMNVREGIAAKAARELVLYDDWTDELVEAGTVPQPQAKLDEWEQEWNQTVARYAEMDYY
ncbi:MAG: hypothetical protein ABEI57_05590, partial [Halapricum sp.]